MTGSHCVFHQRPEHLEDFGRHDVPLYVHVCLVPLPQGLHELLGLQPLLQALGVPQRAGELGALQVVVAPALSPGRLVSREAFQWDCDVEQAGGQNLGLEKEREEMSPPMGVGVVTWRGADLSHQAASATIQASAM